MKRIKIDDDVYTVLQTYARKNQLFDTQGRPSVSRAIKIAILRRVLNLK